MKITTEPVGERQLRLEIEVDDERVERARRRTARQISREVDIPGFRKGKAPYEVVLQRFGEDVLRQEMVSSLAEDLYRRALEEEDVTPYAPGTLEETTFDPLTLTFLIPLVPEVDLGDYREYRLDAPDVEVQEETVDEAVEAIRERNAVLAPLDRAAAEGNLVVVELIGRTQDGQEFLHEEEAQIVLDPEDEALIPGLADGLIGLEAGEERSFSVVLPDDFRVKELAGQQVVFEASGQAVYERILPDLDDDLARTVGNYDSFEELVTSVRRRLRERERARAESAYADQVLEEIVDQAEVSYPPIMLEEALDEALEDYEKRVERTEHMMLEDFLRIQGQTMEELEEELRAEVEESLVRSLVLGEIVEREEIEVSDEALDVRIAESSERYGERADEVQAAFSAPEARRGVRNRMLANRAVERLVSIARGEVVDEPSAGAASGEATGEAESEVESES